MAQSVERRLGKAEVTGSIPVISFLHTYNIKSTKSFVDFFVYKTVLNIYKNRLFSCEWLLKHKKSRNDMIYLFYCRPFGAATFWALAAFAALISS